MLLRNQLLKLLLLTTLVFVSCANSFSQIEQPNRYEKERKFNDTDFTLISLEADGLALIREKREFKKGNQTWELFLIDTTLHEAEPIEFEVNHSYHLTGFEQTPGEVSFLFNESELKGYMTLVTVDIKSKNVKLYEIKPEINLRLTQFCKVGGNFVFGGFVNRESALLLYNPTTDNLKVVPGFFLKETDLVDMRVNQNQTFNTILIERSPNRIKRIIFKTFDDSGKQILEDITSIDEDIELQTSISSTLEREDLAILGTWGKLNSKQASGFYAIPVNPFTDLKVNRIHFGALQHYLDYLKPNKAAKIKAKSLDAIEAGKIPDFTDHVMPFKIVEYKDGFLLLAEAYIPSPTINQYQGNMPYSTNYPYYSQNGGYYPSNRIYSPFTPTYGNNVANGEESKTIESVVVAFDGSGKILWDYSLPLTNMKMPSLEQVCDFALIENKIHFLYKNESELRIKTINLDDQEVVESAEKIKLSNPLDELRSESEQVGTVKHWFGKNFYVWGYQSVRNKAKAEGRQVLYINKVVVH